MSRYRGKLRRIPRIAIVGLFQGGKSLLINAALGGPVVPVGKFGLRTTPCRITCRYGELNRAVAYLDGMTPKGFNIHAFQSFVESSEHVQHLRSIEFFHCHPILQRIELIDTPGFDFSDTDDASALTSAKDADAVVLVVQQSLPSATKSFSRLASCLRNKPWGMVLNCGRAGAHLESPESPASIEVEKHCIRQLLEVGLEHPLFTQRLSARTLSYYASEPNDLGRSKVLSEEHLDDLAADERSVRIWRENLLGLGACWEEHRLEKVRRRILKLLEDQQWSEPTFRFNRKRRSFSCRVSHDGWSYRITGEFRIEAMSRYDRLQLHNLVCKEQWVVDWLSAQPKWPTWKF